jgi:NADH-quinone oxidoreductase subunit E
MNVQVPPALEADIDALIARYPQRRSATVMVLHALQDHFGCLRPETVLWTAAKLGLEPIHVYELVTFYPMFRQTPAGKFHFKICRTLSCALAGSHDLHRHLCERLGLDPALGGAQTTADGRFTVEFVECLAGCDTAPALMCNDQFHPSVTPGKADEILDRCG